MSRLLRHKSSRRSREATPVATRDVETVRAATGRPIRAQLQNSRAVRNPRLLRHRRRFQPSGKPATKAVRRPARQNPGLRNGRKHRLLAVILDRDTVGRRTSPAKARLMAMTKSNRTTTRNTERVICQ